MLKARGRGSEHIRLGGCACLRERETERPVETSRDPARREMLHTDTQTETRQFDPVSLIALRVRLDPGGRALAAQDFRHTFQRETEQVGDFIRRLERTFSSSGMYRGK